MLKIGDFSTLSRISIHMLRHYDEIGLLHPHHTDEFTGYRYYSEEQLTDASRIQALKNMGLSLAMIKEILSEYDDADMLKRYLTLQMVQKKEELSAMQNQLQLIDTAIKSIERGSAPSECSIAVKEIPKRNIVSLRQVIPNYNDEGLLWEALCEEAELQNIQYSTPSYNIAVFHDEGYKEQGVDVEIQRSVIGSYHDTVRARFKTVEPITVATITYQGAYDLLEKVNASIAKWALCNQYELVGPMFNIYHISPQTEPNPENLITEVCFPIRKK